MSWPLTKTPLIFRSGVSKPYDLHYSGPECETVIGGNRFSWRAAGEGTQYAALAIDGLAMVGFGSQGNHLLLRLLVFDDFNQLMLQIVDNWLMYSTIPWDIELVGRNLIVREEHHKILIDIIFEVPDRIVIRRGRFLRNGVELLIAPDTVLLTNTGSPIAGNTAKGGSVGLGLGTDIPILGCGYRMAGVPRYSSRALRSSEARTLMRRFRASPGMDEVDLSSLDDLP